MKEKFARFELLLLEYLKRDRTKIVVWVIGLSLFCGGFVPAFVEITKGDGLIGYYETMKNPAMISITGPSPIKSAEDYTLGAMYAQEMLLFSALCVMIVSALHVIKHTRKEEEQGLTELIRSFQVGRQANSLAVFIETFIINILLTLATAGLLISFRAESMTVSGSFLFAKAIGMAGMVGAAVALLFSQIMPTSQSSTGSTLGLIGLLYAIRGATDNSILTLSKFNPIGWIYLTFPYTKNNWYYILFSFVFALVLMLFAVALEGGRDMGAGYLPQKEGRASAKKSLLSVHGLILRTNRGMIIGWLIGFFAIGVTYGAIYGDMQSFLEGNELLKQMFLVQGFSIEESFTSVITMIIAALCAILPIAVINKLYTEETRHRLGKILATKVKRGKVFLTTVIISVLCGTIGLLVSSFGLGAAALSTMKNSVISMGDFLMAGINFLPAILFIVGLTAFALGLIPKAGKAVYIYLTYSFILTYFGGIVKIPKLVLKTSILELIPSMPVENFRPLPFIVISLVGIALIILGYIGYNKRDLHEGA